MITVRQLNNEIKKGKIYPVYLLMGEEREEKKEAIEQIINKISGNVNRHTFFGDEVEISDVLNELQTYSFFDNLKVVIVKNIEKMNLNESFFSYLGTPNERSILFLLTDKNDMSKKLQTSVEKVGRVVKFWKNFQENIEKWIISELKKRNIDTNIEVVRYLIEVTGNQKEDILNQINMISNYLEKGEVLEIGKLKKIVSRIAGYNVFDLINSIFMKDSIELIRIFRTLIENGEDITKINYFLWKYLKTLIVAGSYKIMGYTDSRIVSTLKLRKLESGRVLRIISHIHIDLLNKLMNHLEKIDYSAKTRPKYISTLQFEELLLSLKKI